MKQLSADGQEYAKEKALTSFDIDGSDIVRPEPGIDLELQVASSGQMILSKENGDIAIPKYGDVLEMYRFNKRVKRALRLQSKGPVQVKIVQGKDGNEAIQCNDVTLSLNALRGNVNFTVIALAPPTAQPRGTFETI